MAELADEAAPAASTSSPAPASPPADPRVPAKRARIPQGASMEFDEEGDGEEDAGPVRVPPVDEGKTRPAPKRPKRSAAIGSVVDVAADDMPTLQSLCINVRLGKLTWHRLSRNGLIGLRRSAC